MTPAALAALRQQDRVSFPELLATLHAEKHTGAVILHVCQGTPTKVEFPSPSVAVLLELSSTSGAARTREKALDNRRQ